MFSILYLLIIPTAKFCAAQSAAQYGWSLLDYDNKQWSSVEERDICVIGGGSSGTHAAVRLTDMNQTVAIVEQRNYLGGHTYTYKDPQNHQTFDIGVIVFQPWKIVHHHFSRFNIPLVNESTLDPNKLPYPCWQYNSTIGKYLDFRDGSPHDYNPYPPGVEQGIGEALKVLANYMYILTSYNLPKPVPEDFYMPFGAFVKKYNMTAITRFNHFYNQGQADMLNIPTLYIIKYFNYQDYLDIVNGANWQTTARYRNSELYEKSADYIGHSNIFLSSSILETRRSSDNSTPHEILITTPTNIKLLKCSKILSTIPPMLSNMANWDLTSTEVDVFSKFTTTNAYYTALARIPNLPDKYCFTNVAGRPPYNLPVFPGLYAVSPWPSNPGVWNLKFSSPSPTITTDQVKAIILSQINVLERNVNASISNASDIDYLVFHSHTPFQVQVSPAEIKNGFYDKLQEVQGGLNGKMWYSGAAFHTHDSSFLWRFNEDKVLPRIMGSAYTPPYQGYVAGGT